MSNIVDISELHKSFKDEVEKNAFLSKQHETILILTSEKKQLKAEIEHLKELLITSTQLLEPKVERIIITPEEAVIESQIQILQNRALAEELTLEDVKKLDLLLKNKNIIKTQISTIKGESKKVDKKNLSSAELLQIAASKPEL